MSASHYTLKLRSVELRILRMPLKEPFITSYGQENEKEFAFITVTTVDGTTGYGECTAFSEPLYLEETTMTAIHVLRDFFIPLVLQYEFTHPDEVSSLLRPFRGHYMAKAALVGAIFDAYCKEQNIALAKAIGATKTKVQAGISIGIAPSLSDLLKQIENYLSQGFARIKIKIKPGYDLDIIRQIRNEFGNISLMADANSAYTLDDLPRLKALDEFSLMMIEQPLAYDDIIDHARLQQQMMTPICLDESIRTVDDARKAIQIGACKVINVKIGRVGGLTYARDIVALAKNEGVATWCGGMLEAGVGRLCNIAISALDGMVLPGDLAPSARYFEEDIIEPQVTFSSPGLFAVSTEPGLGAHVLTERVERRTVYKQLYTNSSLDDRKAIFFDDQD